LLRFRNKESVRNYELDLRIVICCIEEAASHRPSHDVFGGSGYHASLEHNVTGEYALPGDLARKLWFDCQYTPGDEHKASLFLEKLSENLNDFGDAGYVGNRWATDGIGDGSIFRASCYSHSFSIQGATLGIAFSIKEVMDMIIFGIL
jgi:hypothetical protein